MSIDASKLRRLDPFESNGKFGLIVALHGSEEGTRYFDTEAARDALMDELYVGWKESRKITGPRAPEQEKNE